MGVLGVERPLKGHNFPSEILSEIEGIFVSLTSLFGPPGKMCGSTILSKEKEGVATSSYKKKPVFLTKYIYVKLLGI